jgi:uncharacterized membrane protein YqjE
VCGTASALSFCAAATVLMAQIFSQLPHMTHPPVSMPDNRHHGVGESMRSLLQAIMHYAEARFRLFWLESTDVLHRVAIVASLAVAAVVGVLFTYIALMVALVLWIARTWWGNDVLPAVLIVALAHLLAAGACAAWMMRTARRGEMFHATLNEFREDRRWLEEKQTSSN